MARFSVRALGFPEIRRDDRLCALSLRKGLALLVYLAEANGSVGRDVFAERAAYDDRTGETEERTPVRDASQHAAQSDQHTEDADEGADSQPDDQGAADDADRRAGGQGDGDGCSTAGQLPGRTQSARSASAGLAGTDSADSFKS